MYYSTLIEIFEILVEILKDENLETIHYNCLNL